MKKSEKIDMFEFMEMYPDERSARRQFEKLLWRGRRFCGHCGSVRTKRMKHPSMPYWCRDCRKMFSVRTGTILATSNISFRKWLLSIYLLNTNLKGVSSCKLGRNIGVTQKTAWFLLHRLRKAFEEQSENPLLSPVEVDESYIGGLERNKHLSKRTKGVQGRSIKVKSAVVGIRSRIDNKVRVKVTGSVKREDLHKMIEETVKDGATVYTDQNLGYSGLSNKGCKHETVNHSVGEYIRDQVHTNGMESFWSMVKRGFMGVYHKMSRKHLQRYIDEYAGRHNNRPLSTLMQLEKVIEGLCGKRLKYADLIE